jgi:hypothetical protein
VGRRASKLLQTILRRCECCDQFALIAAKVLMMPNEMPAAIRPYSMAVLPDRSQKKRLTVSNIGMCVTSPNAGISIVFSIRLHPLLIRKDGSRNQLIESPEKICAFGIPA